MLNTDKKLVVYIVALPCPPVPVPVPSLILSLESGFLALPLSIVALPRRRPSLSLSTRSTQGYNNTLCFGAGSRRRRRRRRREAAEN